jgi:hypothetical protein
VGDKLLNFSTSIEVPKTLGQIMGILAAAGAKKVQAEYDDGEPVSLQFLIATKYGERGFSLPANVERVGKVLSRLYEQKKLERRHCTSEQAARVAWRILKDWIEAQLALIQADMVDLEVVMLPYMLDESGKTVYQLMEERHLGALPPGRR